MTLDGKVIMVTGSSSGMGRAAARRLVADGARVVLVARREQDTAEFGDRAIAIRADVTDEAQVAEAVAEAVARAGRLHGAFNNAGGVNHTGPLDGLGDEAWQADLAQNLTSVFYCLKHQAPAIAAAGGGAIVNNASIGGVTGIAGLASYVAAKHGVVGLTKSVALEWAARKVRVNALVTGNVDTPLYRRLLGVAEDDPGELDAPNPTGRVADGAEVGAGVRVGIGPDAALNSPGGAAILRGAPTGATLGS
ncbi:SDR family NAD(P)-dependent oxidoreductase, partial [Actinoplanes sp. NPDC051633]|uniref:SDR family NAD(P)-dependent oxidoreductase n=1 Tax=Actinoplanes sp. NPDC051633 TaxID=3155670 RepID=UPI003424ABD7